MSKINCTYEWTDVYTEPSAISASLDGDCGVLTIEGIGDGTLDLVFSFAEWTAIIAEMAGVQQAILGFRQDPEVD